MPEKETQFGEIIKLFSLVLKQSRLYSATHPAAQLAFRNFYSGLQQLVTSDGALTFGFMEAQIVVNEQPFDRKKTGVGDLLKECQHLHIESLIFEPGVTEEELNSLVRVMTIPRGTIEAEGGFKKAFEKEGFQRIRLGMSRYRMIKEEEEVVKKSELGPGQEETEPKASRLPRGKTVERMEEVIEHGLTGAENEIHFDLERLGYEVERKPESVARQMVRQADNLESLKRIVQDMGHFLRDRLAQPFVQQGKDFSRSVSRLAKEFKKVVESFDTPEDFRGSVNELVTVLERCADAVKLELIVRTFEQGGGDGKSLERIKTKFLASKEARARILEPLKERLLSLGVGETEFEQAFSVEEKRAPKKATTTEVSVEELAELRRIKERYEKEVKGPADVSAGELAEVRQIKERYEKEIKALKGELQRAHGLKERLENIIGSLAEGLVVVDNEGKIQMMNPAAEKLLGMNQTQGLGVPIGQSLKSEHIVALTKGPLLEESDDVNKEIQVQTIDDETRKILQASSAVIENEAGQTVGMVAVLSDITKQKKLDEMKSKFVAHVSHELRTPLLAIEQSLHILLAKETEAASPEQEKFLLIADRNISRLSRLVNDLLDVAKIEAREMRLKPVSFKIADLVHHVVETVRGWAESKKITIQEKLPAADVEVEADPDRIIQVVTNLMGNAVKFTPDGGKITLELDPNRVEEEISTKPCIAISVQDTGVGILQEDQERIFRKFEQGSLPSPSEGIGSTGLGLTIAKEIIDLHRGKIWVESKPGKGSRFIFAIPKRLKDRATEQQQAPAP